MRFHASALLAAVGLFMVFFAAQAHAEASQIAFDGENYLLREVKKTKKTLTNSYLPSDQKPDRWTKILMVHRYPKHSGTPAEFAAKLETIIKKDNPSATVNITPSTSGEVMMQYLTWSPDREVTEYDILKVKKVKKDMMIYRYAFRTYGKPTDLFMKHMSDAARLSSLLAAAPYPELVSKLPQRTGK